MAKDFLGQEISVGDIVVFVEIDYRNLMLGTVDKITPKMVFLSHQRGVLHWTSCKQFHNQVVVIPKEGQDDGSQGRNSDWG